METRTCERCGQSLNMHGMDYCPYVKKKEGGYLSTELLTVTALSLIPVTLIVIWVAKMAGMVAGV